jgi:hypothetical protein
VSTPDGRTVILVPFRGEPGSRRKRIFQSAVLPHLAGLAELIGAEVVQADSGHQPFSVGNSFNLAANLADAGGRWEVALLHEADFLVEPRAVAEAVELVRAGHRGMVYAWSRHLRLTQGGTEKMLGGQRARFLHRTDFRLGSSTSPGGPRVVPRALWDAVGGFHPAFVGWGYEDNHFAWKTAKLAGSRRISGDLLNAWHPRRRDQPEDPYFAAQTANFELWTRLREEGS